MPDIDEEKQLSKDKEGGLKGLSRKRRAKERMDLGK